jgi:hypothetical protein
MSIYYKCTLSSITHKLNASGQVSIWTYFLVLECGTRAQGLSVPFSYALYNAQGLVYELKQMRKEAAVLFRPWKD